MESFLLHSHSGQNCLENLDYNFQVIVVTISLRDGIYLRLINEEHSIFISRLYFIEMNCPNVLSLFIKGKY